MPIATLEFDAPQGHGANLRAECRAVGSDIIAVNGSSSASAEGATDFGSYAVTFTGLASGLYKLRIRTITTNLTIARGLLQHVDEAAVERPATDGQVAITDFLKADRYIDISVTPWRLVLIKKGTGSLSSGTRLLEQLLLDKNGAPISNISTFVGRSVAP